MILQGSQGHKLINKEALIPISTIANQVDKVCVMQKAKHKNLNQKFSISLKTIPVKLFHCNYLETNKFIGEIDHGLLDGKSAIDASNEFCIQVYHNAENAE